MRMIADHPWLGVGLGGFEAVFPSYRPAEVTDWGVWDRAHSVPLQIAAELGLPFALLMVSLAALALITLFVTMLRRRTNRSAISLEALAFVLLGLLHSIVDFSLQIPGYSIFFAGWMGVGLASVVSDRSPAAVGNIGQTAVNRSPARRTMTKDYLDS
jgi:O-antigen ligase